MRARLARDWRDFRLWVFQWRCWFRYGHTWADREIDLNRALPGFRNPWIEVCGRCGTTMVREEDE